ncbi:phosphate ABC transporter permease PstA [Pelagibius sp. Alg239-R121]|uniref:phosphate ABC transporter permease PstA n=1 Tax=Pelagibius sp. Alg239-R121 TaxID=2993448 RepID=UPI0024A6E7F7|nr:phosphate ABC transporter permease PstA [Pelagibius sp. Alg239-R121]
MTEMTASAAPFRRPDLSEAHLRRRYSAERRFKAYGIFAIAAATAMLLVLLSSIVAKGYTAFSQTYIALDIALDADRIDPSGDQDPQVLRKVKYQPLAKAALRDRFPEVSGRRDKRALSKLISGSADVTLRKFVMANPDTIGTTQTIWVKASDEIDSLRKGHVDRGAQESDRLVSDQALEWFDHLETDGAVDLRFNTTFFTAGDSREPEQAGIWGATVGSFLMLIVTLALSFPVGVLSAVYLEEFAPKNRWTDFIEVNINNLAAVPSIVFGLLGLAVFLNFFGLPRSAPLAGGMVLALMTLPTIIIAARAALKAVPPSIREAALGVGASKLQTVTHHVLPLAMPGVLTGTILGSARALGETAPLLMIGMVAFIVDIPGGFTDPATALPVQIYLWADSPERAFVEKTSAAIIVLLGFLIMMNAIAVLLRKRFERRW